MKHMNMKECPGWASVALLSGIVSMQAASGAGPSAVGAAPFEVDSTRSRAVIQVGKSGPFSFVAGHTHEVVGSKLTGVIGFDRDAPAQSTVRLEIDARTLRVTGKGDPPEDVPKVQEVMEGAKVLDVARFPSIRFESTNVTVKSQTSTALDLIVAGRVTLRDVTRAVTAPVHVVLGTGSLTADGSFSIKQSDFGITPISVAGAVAVKDALAISFTVLARDRTAAER
jgi:polyisoprenoid-binding protein YceI